MNIEQNILSILIAEKQHLEFIVKDLDNDLVDLTLAKIHEVET